MWNFTDEYALVHQNTTCSGPVIEVIPPGGESSAGTVALLGRAVCIR
ncbi:hypothetical protein [Streptomyces sp. NPDC056987]